MIHFVVPEREDSQVREYLGLWGQAVAPRFRIVCYESLARTAEAAFAPGAWVFSALDRLSSGMETFAGELHDRLTQAGSSCLNDPGRTLLRRALLERLHSLGGNDFRAVRASDDFSTLRYPVFLRRARTHDGAISPLLRSPAQTRAAIGRALVQGHPHGDLLVVEFCETADAGGFYRKYAAFAVGGTIIARSLNYGREWMMKHQGTEYSRAMVVEERDYVAANPHRQALERIFQIARTDYGRIDYSLKDGRVQAWEINLNPQIGRGRGASRGRVPSELDAIRTETKNCFYSRFNDAWVRVDGVSDGPAIRIAFDPRTVRGAVRPAPRVSRVASSAARSALSVFRAALRPVKPFVEPFAPPFLRVLESIVRGVRRRRA